MRDGLLYNEAAALDRLAESAAGDDDRPFCRALQAYRKALPVARNATRPVIEKQVAALSRKCPPAGALRVVCVPTGGTVALDGIRRKQPCPARFDDLRPRTWTGVVTAAGRAVPFEVEVPTGQQVEHRVVLDATPTEPAPASTVSAAQVPAPPSSGVSMSTLGWGAIALGAASAGVATYAWIDPLSLIDDGQAAIDRGDVEGHRAAEQSYGDRETLHLITSLTAGALVATGLALLYLGDETPPEGAAHIEPIVGPVSGLRIRFWP